MLATSQKRKYVVLARMSGHGSHLPIIAGAEGRGCARIRRESVRRIGEQIKSWRSNRYQKDHLHWVPHP